VIPFSPGVPYGYFSQPVPHVRACTRGIDLGPHRRRFMNAATKTPDTPPRLDVTTFPEGEPTSACGIFGTPTARRSKERESRNRFRSLV